MSRTILWAACALTLLAAGWLLLREGGQPSQRPGPAERSDADVAMPEAVTLDEPSRRAAATEDGRTVVEPPSIEHAADRVILRGRCLAAEDGAPLADVETRLRAFFAGSQDLAALAWQAPAPARTGADGRFEFAVAAHPLARFTLSCWRTDRLMRSNQWEPGVLAGTVLDLGDVVMESGHRILGRVVDEQGSGVARVRVQLESLALGSRSEDDGRFEFESAVPEGSWPLDIQSPACDLLGPELLEVGAAGGPPDFVVRVRVREAIRGIVVDEQGLPIAGARVGVLTEEGWQRESCTANPEGEFTLYRRESEANPTVIEVSGLAATSTQFPGAYPWGASGARFVVRRARAVEIRVVEKGTGTPVEEYAVLTMRDREATEFTGPRHAGRHLDGRLDLDGMQEGENLLMVVPASLELMPCLPVMIRVSDSLEEPVVVELRRLQPLQVLVCLRDGTPVAGTTVRMLDHAPPYEGGWIDPRTSNRSPHAGINEARVISIGVTGVDGLTSVRVPPDATEVYLHASGEHLPVGMSLIRPLEQAAPLRVVVSRGGTIRGVVRMPPDQVGRFNVLVQYEDRKNWQNAGPRTLEPLGADGSFRYDALEPRLYRVFLARRRDFKSNGWSVDGWYAMDELATEVLLAAGEERVVDLDAMDYADGAIEAVFLLDGAPAARATVALSRRPAVERNDGWLSYGTFLTDTEGRLTVEGLMPGEYFAHLELSGPAREKLELSSERTFTVAPGARERVELRFKQRRVRLLVVAEEDDQPLGGRRCAVNGLDAPHVLSDEMPWPTIGPDGILILDCFPAGSFTLSVFHERTVRFTESFTIPDEPSDEPIVVRALPPR